MKKTFRILAISLFSITAMTVASCDNESYDSIIEGEQGVGKPIMTIHNQGETILMREGIVAELDKNGRLEIKVKLTGSENYENDELILRTLKFQSGNFPTNVNESNYYSWENKLLYTTKDTLRPNIVTGIMSICNINRKARVLSGDFDIKRMMPSIQDDPNLKSFPISGNFVDIPFVRKEATYLEAFADNEPFTNPEESVEVKAGRAYVSSIDGVEKTQKIVLDFPYNNDIVVSNDPKDFKKLGWFNVEYTSPYGVKYTSKDVAESEGFLRFDYAEKDKDDPNKFLLKGRFEATLVGVEEEDQDKRVKITYGDFSVIIISSPSK
ncbi:hypothetical protein [Myroides odoratimimus]|uniref:hypothetical protein n=1 Tax=Myroides odoratimimus TaxID=76832 RepID=UPI0009106841|nr:hypothetical protein [Myroides odoratimimus]SHM63721.1 hypothetical protein SAMN05444275_11852 [Myroides odoratimimus subsp. xuanwuensis]